MKNAYIFVFLFLLFFFFSVTSVLFAQENTTSTTSPNVSTTTAPQELREKIKERNKEVEKIEQEIDEYLEELEAVQTRARTLKNAVRELELQESKLNADIRLTEQQINSTSLTIDRLTNEIREKDKRIERDTEALGQAIRKLHKLESRSLVEIVLSQGTFSSFWSNIANISRFQESVRENMRIIRNLKREAEKRQARLKEERQRLVGLKQRLLDQGRIVEENKKAQNRLLTQTKNTESNYQKLLEERRAQKEALEQELIEFESQLDITVDAQRLPETEGDVLRWPLDNVAITQYFGNTPFATENPQIYKGEGHNGIDLRASVGTVVHAAANGVVMDTGNTDTQCFGVSHGKWVLVRHYNGLATIYSHLSLISAEPGQEVEAGDVVAYTGASGYVTGPHLHFTVLAQDAVRVTNEYTSKVCGTQLKLPLSPQEGYLNPLSYLPEIEKND